MIEEIVSANAIKLKLSESMRIHLVVNVSRIARYRELVEKQKVKEMKPIEVEKILNKRKIKEVVKYLV